MAIPTTQRFEGSRSCRVESRRAKDAELRAGNIMIECESYGKVGTVLWCC